MNNNRVPRKLAIIAVILPLLLLAGCGWLNSNNAAESDPAASTPIATDDSSPSASSPAEATTPPPASSPAASSTPSEEPDDSDPVLQAVRAMSLEEKVGQLILAGVEGTSIDSSAKEMLAKQHVGGIILYKNNVSTLGGSVKFINDLKKANAGNPAPLFVSVDQEGGKVSRLPADFAAMPDAAKVGRTGDASLAEEEGDLIARELKLMGFNVDFAPVLDVNSNPDNPVIGTRSYGTTAKQATKMGIAAMEGLRGGGMVAVVKHFPGHGDTSVDSHLELPLVNKTTKQLQAMEWIPFKAAIEADADAVMVAHILFPKIDPDAPASISKIIIGDQLRGTLGYQGVVITDDMTMGAIANNYGIAEAALKSIEAGSDIVLIAHGYDTAKSVYDKLLSSAKSGKLTEARIEESVVRIMKLKMKYELSDEAVPIPTAKQLPNDDIGAWLKKVNGSQP